MAVNYRHIRWTIDKRKAGSQGNVQATSFELLNGGTPIAYDVPAARSTLGARFEVGSQTWRYLRFTVTETVAPNAGRVQVNEFQLTLSGSLVSWPVGTAATNPGGNNQDNANGAIDGDTSGTKWGDGLINANGFAILHIDTQTGVTFDAYQFYTGNDSTNADPAVWLLEGSDDNSAWTTIDDHPYYTGSPSSGDEWPLALLDENDGTKWNASNYVGSALTFEWQRAFTAGFDGYRYKTGNDDENRDPVSWTLEGSLNGTDWDLLDTRVDETITSDRGAFTQEFEISGAPPEADEQPAAKRMGGVRGARPGLGGVW